MYKLIKRYLSDPDSFHGNRQDKTLLKEEHKAEKNISTIRLVFYALVLLQHILKTVFVDSNLLSSLWASMLIFIASLGIFIEIRLFGKEKLYRYYNRAIKYFYTTADIFIISYLIYANYDPVLLSTYTNMSPAQFIPLIFLILHACFLVIGIFRFNPIACVYTGGASIISFIVMYIQLLQIRSFQDFFFQDAKYNISTIVYFTVLLSLTVLSSLIATRLKHVIVTSKRQEDLERFLPEFVAHEIMSGSMELSVGGERKIATILFSDIRNFTTMSENSQPEEVLDFLNSYFNDMIEVIFQYKGTLDKIIGDGIMAIFGAPFFSNDSTSNAVKTAIDMQKKLLFFNEVRILQNKEPIKIGIGIHTGEVILGRVGTSKRMEFTAIGDTVNTASRLESYTKETKANIIISDTTRGHLNGDFRLEYIGDVFLKGKHKQIKSYSVLY
ncbi:MAG: adenylate/guanylate cyclase domain-containing protein [Leptospiraceae bacterium]|nr:adenylate/guanylate cyclase domain-containing protein [Leptospiraceae bacterium]